MVRKMTKVMSKPLNEEICFDNSMNTIYVRNNNILKINDYFTHNIDLKKFKLNYLRPIAKYYKLKSSGNKNELIDRIINFFVSTKNSIIIQSWWRRHIVILFFKLRGPAYKNNNLCVNDNDFWTLEPISKISKIHFFTYTSLDKIYGCNFKSILELLNHNSNPSNPYDREPISKNTIKEIMNLFYINKILFPEYEFDNNSNFNLHKIDIPEFYNSINLCYSYFRPKTFNKNILKNSNYKIKYINICNKRITPIEERINSVFILFDRYDNYTQSSWFYNLSFNKLVAFYRCLFDIWNSRFNPIGTCVKRKICTLFDPFQTIFRGSVFYNSNDHNNSIYSMRVACITIIENFLFTSIDDEYSKIGALNCLTAFTVVCPAARATMPWLYDSIR
jgi:hypothetical protein